MTNERRGLFTERDLLITQRLEDMTTPTTGVVLRSKM